MSKRKRKIRSKRTSKSKQTKLGSTAAKFNLHQPEVSHGHTCPECKHAWKPCKCWLEDTQYILCDKCSNKLYAEVS